MEGEQRVLVAMPGIMVNSQKFIANTTRTGLGGRNCLVGIHHHVGKSTIQDMREGLEHGKVNMKSGMSFNHDMVNIYSKGSRSI